MAQILSMVLCIVVLMVIVSDCTAKRSNVLRRVGLMSDRDSCQNNQPGGAVNSLLVKELLDGQDKLVRPDGDYGGPTQVAVRFSIWYVSKMTSEANLFKINGELLANWNDSRLAWTPVDYANADYVLLPYEKIWTPDWSVNNGVDLTQQLFGRQDWLIGVNHTGAVFMGVPFSYSVYCNQSSTQISCPLEVSCWANTGDRVNIQPTQTNPVDLSEFDLFQTGDYTPGILSATYVPVNGSATADGFPVIDYLMQFAKTPKKRYDY